MAIQLHHLSVVERTPLPTQPVVPRGGGRTAQNNTTNSSGSNNTTSTTNSSGASSTSSGNAGTPSFYAMFPTVAGGSSGPAPTPPGPPTAESVFGANPWVTDPTGTNPDGTSYGYNPIYFASAQTAAQVAQLVGGQVVSENEMVSGGPFSQNQPNLMVELPNGGLINPGLVASFYTHGYPQSMVDQMIANEVSGATPQTD